MTDQPVQHPLFRDKPPPEAKLWRYLSFAKFASLLDSGLLHFTRVDKFDDHFEGAWPQQDIVAWQRMQGFNVPAFTEHVRKSVAVSCWIESEYESAAMWGLYTAAREGVAIVTSSGKLDELVMTAQGSALNAATKILAGAARVRYLDHFSEGLLKEDGGSYNAFAPFMLKNISYAHEREVRALISFLDPEIDAGGLDIPIQLTSFIDEIIINPFGQTWFDKTVRGEADHYGLGDRIRSSRLSPTNFYIKR
jgi:hypothetical protein